MFYYCLPIYTYLHRISFFSLKRKRTVEKKKESTVNWLIMNRPYDRFTIRHIRSTCSTMTLFRNLTWKKSMAERKKHVHEVLESIRILKSQFMFGFLLVTLFSIVLKDDWGICISNNEIIMILKMLKKLSFVRNLRFKYTFLFSRNKNSSSKYLVKLWSNFVSLKNKFYLQREEMKSRHSLLSLWIFISLHSIYSIMFSF
jgi:hypothetical protein